MDKPKILITGGLGFIFSHVVEYFIDLGWFVVVHDTEVEGAHTELWEKWGFKVIGCNTPRLLPSLSRFDFDFIIHAGAITSVDTSIKDPALVFQNNTQAVSDVFEFARTVPSLKKILYVSTDEVYGECEQPKREWDVIFPRNPYAASKAAGSLLRTAYENTYPELKDKTAEIRMCNIFGERQSERNVIPLVKRALQTGEPLPYHNAGHGFREYLYVKNIPEIIHLVLERGDRVYNITNNDGYTVQELIEKIERHLGKTIPKTPATRFGMDLKYQMDNTRLKDLGWHIPKFSFEEGLYEYLQS
ncbi:MAG: NAD-dependent epimerase/dehydratase family protein [Candidatus Poseidoniales archaeon]|jgi:dTDP-glucose 4,6-dehydratase